MLKTLSSKSNVDIFSLHYFKRQHELELTSQELWWKEVLETTWMDEGILNESNACLMTAVMESSKMER